MSVSETFVDGIYVTLWGMGLVFLTLIVIMAIIWLLDRVFKPAVEQVTPGAPVVAVAAPSATAQEPTENLSDEVAAVAVAIALQKQRNSARPDDTDVVAEVVTVTTIDAGPGIWRGYGRLKALQ